MNKHERLKELSKIIAEEQAYQHQALMWNMNVSGDACGEAEYKRMTSWGRLEAARAEARGLAIEIAQEEMRP